MNVVQMAKMVGQTVDVKVRMGGGNMDVLCKIEDVKMAYGKVLLQVTPLQGSGFVWVEESSVKMPKKQKQNQLEDII